MKKIILSLIVGLGWLGISDAAPNMLQVLQNPGGRVGTLKTITFMEFYPTVNGCRFGYREQGVSSRVYSTISSRICVGIMQAFKVGTHQQVVGKVFQTDMDYQEGGGASVVDRLRILGENNLYFIPPTEAEFFVALRDEMAAMRCPDRRLYSMSDRASRGKFFNLMANEDVIDQLLKWVVAQSKFQVQASYARHPKGWAAGRFTITDGKRSYGFVITPDQQFYCD